MAGGPVVPDVERDAGARDERERERLPLPALGLAETRIHHEHPREEAVAHHQLAHRLARAFRRVQKHRRDEPARRPGDQRRALVELQPHLGSGRPPLVRLRDREVEAQPGRRGAPLEGEAPDLAGAEPDPVADLARQEAHRGERHEAEAVVGPDAYTPVPEQRHEAFGARLVVARIQVEVRRGRGGGLLQRVAPVAAGRAVVEQRGDRRQERAEHRRGGEQAAQRGGFDVGPLRHAPCRAAGGEREQGDRQQAEKEPGPVHRRCRRARRHRRRRGAVADMEVGEVLRRAVEVELARERHVRLGARALRVVDVVERDVEADPSLRVRPQRIEVPER
ncbi:MAG: hypothetical protein ACYTDU_21240, partial [Planctomycetota bacterium]